MRKYGTPEKISTDEKDPQGVSSEDVDRAASESDEQDETEG